MNVCIIERAPYLVGGWTGVYGYSQHCLQECDWVLVENEAKERSLFVVSVSIILTRKGFRSYFSLGGFLGCF